LDFRWIILEGRWVGFRNVHPAFRLRSENETHVVPISIPVKILIQEAGLSGLKGKMAFTFGKDRIQENIFGFWWRNYSRVSLYPPSQNTTGMPVDECVTSYGAMFAPRPWRITAAQPKAKTGILMVPRVHPRGSIVG
jgi:hypothetical protein